MGGQEHVGYFPARPTLTIVFICAVAFWALCGVAFATGDARSVPDGRDMALAGAGVAGAGGLLAITRRTRWAGLVILSAAVGFSLGSVQAVQMHVTADSLEGVSETEVELVLLEDSVDRGFGETALAKGSVGGCAPAAFSARFDSSEPLLCGQRVRGRVKYSALDYGKDPYSWREGSCGRLVMKGCAVSLPEFPLGALVSLRAAVLGLIGSEDESHALLQALVCGYRRNIDGTDLYAQFQTCGLAHLVAVSGAHLVIVTGLFASLLKRLRAPRRLTIGLLVTVMASYFVIAGMPVSALRATVMSALGLASYFGGRRSSSLNALGIGIFAMVALSPATSVSASFALSALSTMGIILFAPLFHAWLEKTPLARAGFVIDALSLTAAASALSQLYACSLFNQLPLVSPLANVVSAPLFPIVCGAGLAAGMAAAAVPAGAGALTAAPAFAACALSGVVGALARIPCASIPFTIDSAAALVLSGVLAAVLWALWPHDARRVGMACLGAVVSAAALIVVTTDRSDSIVVLDVGQGDAVLVRSRGDTLLVDTGNQDSKLLGELAANRVVHLDSVLISHADDDHCGSLDALQKAVAVDRVIVAEGMLTCQGDSACKLRDEAAKTAPEVVGVALGDRFDVGAFTARVVWPRSFADDGGNADSLCLVLDYDGDDDGSVDFRTLMTGDAEKDELAEMIASGTVGDVDILKVGHHGSRNGSTSEEMRVLKPEIALVSCGANNRYGHPTQEILDQLSAVGAATFRTDQDGMIRCALLPEGITVTRERT